MKYLVLILTMIPALSWGSGELSQLETTGIAIEPISTEYQLDEGRVYPSCRIFEYRRKERQKVLREIEYSLHGHTMDQLLRDSYVLDKYYLDEELWQDETVVVVRRWKMSPELMVQISNNRDEVDFWISGRGIDWKAKLGFFPSEVSFEFDLTEGTIETTHLSYYVDFCSPIEEGQLRWYPETVSKIL
jgi:hypothetical protein